MNIKEISLGKKSLTLLLACLIGIIALSIDMNLPTMSELQRIFSADVSSVQLILSLFLIGFAIGQIICGPASDRLGRKPVLIVGLIVFTLAGIICAVSYSLPMLVIGRFIQGFGASVGPIIARAIIRDIFNSEEASSVLSQITQVMIIAPIIAPTIGGVLLTIFGWHSIFVVLGTCGAILLLISWQKLPETLPKESIEPQTNSIRKNFGIVLSHRQSLRHILTAAFSYAGMFAYISGSPFVFMDVFGISEEHFGFYFAITALAVMIGASINRFLIKRISSLNLLRYGVYLLLAAGILLVTLVSLNVGGLIGVMFPMWFYMLSLGLIQPNATANAMAPHGKLAGVSSSLIGFLQTAGGALTGYLVSLFYNHTPMSLAVMVCVMAILTFLISEKKDSENKTVSKLEASIESV